MSVVLPIAAKRQKLAFAEIDGEDLWAVLKHGWSLTASRYAGANVRGRTVLMHRLIADRMGLKVPKGWQVDHRDLNPLNNTRANLRVASPSQNGGNRGLRRGKKTSRFKGVHWNKDVGKWAAGVSFKGRTTHLGHFVSEDDAARAYDAAAIRNFGEFARPNFPATA